jgi:hypothetical protein
MFSYSRMDERRFWTEWEQVLPKFNLLLTASWMEFSFVTVFPNIYGNKLRCLM